MEATDTPLDILGRQPFVENLIEVIQEIADNGRGCTFSIDGQWGCGKTFLLDMFEKQISLFQDPAAAGDRYLLFRYNCWEYDYYEEPAIAIVAAIREEIHRNKQIFPKLPPKVKKSLNAAKDLGLELFCGLIESKVGANAADLLKQLSGVTQDAQERTPKDHAFDPYDTFRSALKATRDSLEKLAKDKPVILLVDELDRCLPEYAIKVLERLHHLLDGVPNIIVIIAIDDQQLNNTVRKIYGDDVETTQYLRKFISFNMKLDTGTVKESFWEKHASYRALFAPPTVDQQTFLNELATNLFEGIDVRTQEKIIDRTITLHRLAFPSEVPISILIFELIHQVVFHRHTSSEFQHWLMSPMNYTFNGEKDQSIVRLNKYIPTLCQKALSGCIGSFFERDGAVECKEIADTPLGTAFWFILSLEGSIQKSICGPYYYTKADNYADMIASVKSFDNLSRVIS